MIITQIGTWFCALSLATVAVGGALVGCAEQLTSPGGTEASESAALSKAHFGTLSGITKDDAVAFLYMRPTKMQVLRGNRKGEGLGKLHVEVTGPADHAQRAFDLRPRIIKGVEGDKMVLATPLEHADVVWWANNFPHGWSNKAAVKIDYDNQFAPTKGAKRGALDWRIAVRNGNKIETGAIENEKGAHMFTPITLRK